MKLSKRISVLTLVALLVIAASVALSACGELNNYASKYDNAAAYTVADSGEFDSVVDLDIEWCNGSVIVETSDTATTVSFYEETSGEKINEDTTMHYYHDGAKLNIRYAKSGRVTIGKLVKRLYVTIPSNLALREVEIEAISAAVIVKDIQANEVSVESVSGLVNVECTAAEIDVETTSGNIFVDCKASEIDIETVSGRVGLTCLSLPIDLEIDTTSGDVYIYLTNERAFSVIFDTVSGLHSYNFEGMTHSKVNGNNVLSYLGGVQQDAAYCYEVDTTSGNLTIALLHVGQ
ncbi:MAG: DUF4097 domain-containing protein [Clostridiales bacterium]|nr:DUF4097 domain-containing protein [Clostridiales bacterium]